MSKIWVQLVFLGLTWLDVFFLALPYFKKVADVREARSSVTGSLVIELNEWAELNVHCLPEEELFTYPVESETAEFVEAHVVAIRMLGLDVEWRHDQRKFEIVSPDYSRQTLRAIWHSFESGDSSDSNQYPAGETM